MTKLREQMILDMTLRGFAPNTQSTYLRVISWTIAARGRPVRSGVMRARSRRHRSQPDDKEFAKPVMSRIVAANTSGIALRKMLSPAWQVPFTVRLVAETPASSSLRW